MRIQALTLTLLAMPLLAAAQDGPPELRNNPFSRPSSNVVIDDRVSVRTDEPASDPLELQATMIGTSNRLANVGGRILRPGDEFEGHVLVAVHERYAVFRRNGRDTAVYVKPEQPEGQPAENPRTKR